MSSASASRRRWLRCRVSSQPAAFRPKVTGTACCSNVRPGRPVPRSASASRASAVHKTCRRACTWLTAARSCSTAPLSMMSWLVAPQCTQRAASASPAFTCAVSALTSGMAGLPASAVAADNAGTAYRSALHAASIGASAAAGITPHCTWARARARSTSSIACRRASSLNTASTAGSPNRPPSSVGEWLIGAVHPGWPQLTRARCMRAWSGRKARWPRRDQ